MKQEDRHSFLFLIIFRKFGFGVAEYQWYWYELIRWCWERKTMKNEWSVGVLYWFQQDFIIAIDVWLLSLNLNKEDTIILWDSFN